MILSLFDKENSSIGSIATSVIAKEVEKMEGNDIFKYNLKHSQKFKGLKLYKRKHLLSVAVKVKLLFFLSYYFKGQFFANDYNSLNDCKRHEL